MRVLVVGGGGREHALCWRLAQSGHDVVAAPGNPGIAESCECAAVSASDIDGLVALAVDGQFDLVVVGPEAPLVAGLCDRLRERGVAAFGPGADGARLEGSKVFSKEFFARHKIRSAPFHVCRSVQEAAAAVDKLGGRVVVKADGLAAGKGVVVCGDRAQALVAAKEMLEDGRFGSAGQVVVVEQRLEGREVSVMAITDGKSYRLLAQAEDHKALLDGDRGPNTGGMGTVSPADWVTDALMQRVRGEVFDPTVRGLAADGIDYRGVLYAGFMVDPDGTPWILEYNCRFGDPETQPVMMRLKGDLGAWLAGAAGGQLPAGDLEWSSQAAVCVVLAASGYPASPSVGDPITGLQSLTQASDVVVFHAGTKRSAEELTTSGGRVLGVTALGPTVDGARARAYQAAESISFEGMQYRRDIGARGNVERN